MNEYAAHSDGQLLGLLKDSNDAAFTEIFHRYWEKLFFVAHKRLQSAEDAKEVVQNVFLKLWEKRNSLDIQSLPFYLAAMTRHAVYRQWAGEQRKESHLKIVQAQQTGIADPYDIENKQILDILARFANELPDKYRIVFISHKLLDRPLEEVAAELGVSPRTAEGYVAKVMQLMREHRDKIAFSWLLSLVSEKIF